ncbi:MAG: hypothetical protein U1C66_01360 [Patescibacteria group bacterium]|nr:hypothetical protein [Patescibacteria group bacterium]
MKDKFTPEEFALDEDPTDETGNAEEADEDEEEKEGEDEEEGV